MKTKNNSRKTIFNILRVVISAGLLIFLALFLDLGRIAEIISGIWKHHPFYLFAALAGALLYVFIEAYRFQQMLLIQNISLPLLRLTRYCFVGMFFNNFMPTTIGGDIAKGFYVSRDTGEKVKPFVALAAVRILGSVFLTLIAAVALIIGYSLLPNKTPIYMVSLMVAGTFFLILFLSRRKLAVKFLIILKPFKSKMLRRNIIEIYRLFHSHKYYPAQLIRATIATLLIEFIYISFNFIAARGLGFDQVSFKSFLLLIPLISVLTMIPSLNGLGVREGAYVYFFAGLIGKDGAGALSLVMLAILLYLSLVGGIIFAVSGSREKKLPALPTPPPDADFEENTNLPGEEND